MKALVYQGPGKKALEDRPAPDISAPTDAVVRVTKTTICGTDLHILKGDVPTCAPGRILGHEGVGVIEKPVRASRPSVTATRAHLLHLRLRPLRLLPSRDVFPLHDGRLDSRQSDRWHAGGYVRIPHADTSPYPIPKGADEEALVMLSDSRPASNAACSTARWSPAAPSPSSAPGRSASPRC